MSSYIKPENYDMFLESTKDLVGVCDERSLNGVKMFKKPEMGKKIGHLIKRMANFKIGKAIRERDTISRQEATDFLTLHEVEWTEKVSSIAHQTTKKKRFNKKRHASGNRRFDKPPKIPGHKVEGVYNTSKYRENHLKLAKFCENFTV